MFFFTATINSWKLVFNDVYKKIVTDSLQWLQDTKRARIHGFIVMPNHIHLLWSPYPYYDVAKIENMLLSFTAHAFKKQLALNDPGMLNEYVSTQHDRKYHFWERRSRTIEVMSRAIVLQKLDYMHLNPISGRWCLVSLPEQYNFSSARFYLLNEKSFPFLSITLIIFK